MSRDLTIKQRTFIKEYLTNGGNGTQAALKAYDTNDPAVAVSIASENLTKPEVKASIEQVLRDQNITLDTISKEIHSLASVEVEKVSAETKLKANVELLKLLNAYPAQKSVKTSLSIKGNIKDLSYAETVEKLKELDNTLTSLNEDED